MSGGGALRVHVATGGRWPDLRRLGPGDVVLDAGAVAPPPSGVRRIEARDLLPAGEAETLQRRCLAFATQWHAEGGVLSPARVVESEVVLELGPALKLLALLERLAGREGPLVANVDPLLPAVARIREAVAPAVVLEPAVGSVAAGLRRSARRIRRALRGPAARAGRPVLGDDATGGNVVWGMESYRNRPILDALGEDSGFALVRFQRSAENTYLPPGRAAGPVDGGAVSLDQAAETAASLFPDLPGAGRVAVAVVENLLTRVAPAALGEVGAWRALLERRPPAAIVAGIPWAGDLRALALAAESLAIPFLACQDGILCERGAGGVLPGTGAMTWGPRGSAWFARRGSSPDTIHEIGDLWLDALRERVRRSDAAALRGRFSIPSGARILLAGVQNSAPHDLTTDPADPIRALRFLLDAVSGVPGWVLVVKPHPRLTRVDGERRLRLVRELVSGVPGALLVDAAESVADLVSVADAHAGEGDTLSFEAVVCGRPSILVPLEGVPLPYPEFSTTGAMPVVASRGELRDLLSRGPTPAGPDALRRLLGEHLLPRVSPADAVRASIGGATS